MWLLPNPIIALSFPSQSCCLAPPSRDFFSEMRRKFEKNVGVQSAWGARYKWDF